LAAVLSVVGGVRQADLVVGRAGWQRPIVTDAANPKCCRCRRQRRAETLMSSPTASQTPQTTIRRARVLARNFHSSNAAAAAAAAELQDAYLATVICCQPSSSGAADA